MTTNPANLIQPLPVERDSDGYWFHIGVPNFDEGEDEQYKAWLKGQGLVTAYKMLDGEHDAHPVSDSYFEHGNPDISGWEPTPPAGEGWFTISIHDTEDGPIWVWARRAPEIGAADLQDDDAAVFDDHAVDLFAKAMKDKLAIKRQQGFGGWHDISRTSSARLADLLMAAVAKGDPIDVANFAMMLFCRNESHTALKSSCAKFIGGGDETHRLSFVLRHGLPGCKIVAYGKYEYAYSFCSDVLHKTSREAIDYAMKLAPARANS